MAQAAVNLTSDKIFIINRLGNGLKFDAFAASTNSHKVTVAENAAFDFGVSTAFSVAVWCHPQIPTAYNGNNSTKYSSLIQKRLNATNAKGWSIYLRDVQDGTFTVDFIIEGVTGQGGMYVRSIPYAWDRDYHIVVTKTTAVATSGVIMYVNGVATTLTALQNTLTTSGAITGTGEPLTIGSWVHTAFSNHTGFAGYIQDVKLISRVLTAAEVLSGYKNDGILSSAVLASERELDWRFNSRSGLVAVDNSPNLLDGTLNHTAPQTTLGSGNYWVDGFTLQPITS